MTSRHSRILATALLSVSVLSFTCAVHSQETPPPANTAPASATAPAVDPGAHQAALRLVAALDLKQKMAAGVDSMLDQGVAAMKAQFPNLRPEFAEEWRKRMKARVNPDDFVAIVANVYEKHLSTDELGQLTDTVINKKQGKPTELSPALQERFQKESVAIQSEIIGGSTQLGAKLGGEIGQDIGKEHPEWAPQPAVKSAPAAK